MFVTEYEEYRYSLRAVGRTAEHAENLLKELFEQQKENFRFRWEFDPSAMNTYEVKVGLKLIDSGVIE